MKMEVFEKIIKETLDELPADFIDILKKNQIKVLAREEMPEPLRNEYPGQTVFGIFAGVPFGRFFNIQYEPTRIELYKKSFEESFSSADEIKKQIIITIIHEIAHYFGFSESEIRKLGY